MLDDNGFEIYEENTFPIAYLLTFRTFGTWLHGDERGSIERSRNRRFKTIRREPNAPLQDKMELSLNQEVIILNGVQRNIVQDAIVEVCSHRSYEPRAINIRRNHVHAVVSRAIKPEKIVNDLKAYATRRLREAGHFGSNEKVWARGASMRYLWKPHHVEAAVDYVLYSQGDIPFEAVVRLD